MIGKFKSKMAVIRRNDVMSYAILTIFRCNGQLDKARVLHVGRSNQQIYGIN